MCRGNDAKKTFLKKLSHFNNNNDNNNNDSNNNNNNNNQSNDLESDLKET